MNTKTGKILIIDDNRSVLRALDLLFKFEFEEVRCISSPKQLPMLLEKQHYDVILLDMNFSAGVNTGNEGMYWLKRIQNAAPDISVVLITAYGDVELAVKAVKEGATDFVLKPWNNNKMLSTVQAAYKLSTSRREVKSLKSKEEGLRSELNKPRQSTIGSSTQITQMQNMVRKVAKTDANVLITGENGTGKELVAWELHRLSSRANQLFVGVDMGAIAETLFESELFGHVKGAFTDAHEDRTGKFVLANDGTLFLDEIGNLSLPLQAKLLAAIQNRQITKVGHNQAIPIDIRLVCATNCNLEEMVSKEQFREDLLYRINTIHIEVPPLREREGDVKALSEFFLKKYANKYGKGCLNINNLALRKLEEYKWPGNVRELQHSIEKAVILCEGKTIKPEDFQLKPTSTSTDEGELRSLEDMEKQMIERAIFKHESNLSAAAKQLGVTRQTLYNKMKRYDI